MSLTRSAAIYGRISRDPGSTLEGVKRQVQDATERVAIMAGTSLAQLPGSPIERKHPEHGQWPLGVFVDNDISARKGSRDKRPEYDRLMAHIHGGDIQVIVSTAQSRLWRSTLQRGQALSDLRDLDIRLVFLKGKIGEIDLSRAADKLMAGVVGEFDAYEAEVAAERQQDAARHFAAAGAYHGARPFGFTLAHVTPDGSVHPAPPSQDGKSGHCEDCAGRKAGMYRTLAPHPGEAPALREAYELVNGGVSVYHACLYLDGHEIPGPDGVQVSRAAIPTAGGHRWSEVGMQSLLLALRAPRNIGKRQHSPRWDGGKRPPGKLYDAHWQPIIGEDLFYAVQDRLAHRQPATPGAGGQPPAHLLTGFAYCGKCGKKLRIHKIKGKRRYACTTFGTGGQGCVSRDAESVEAEVERVLYEWFAGSGLLTKSLEVAGNTDLQELYAKRKRLRDQRNELADKLSDEIIDDETYIRLRTRKAEQIAAVEDEIKAARSAGAGGQVPDLPTGAEFRHHWRAADLAERRRIVAKSVGKVLIHPIGAGNRPDPLLVQVFPGPWAAGVDKARPVPVPDLAGITSKGKIQAFLQGQPGQWFTRQEIAAGARVTLNAAHKHLRTLGAAGKVAREWRRRGGKEACFMYSAGSGTWEPSARNAPGPRGGASRDTIRAWLARSPAEWFTLAQIAAGTGTTERHASKILADLAAGRFLVRQWLKRPHQSGCYVYSVSGK